MRTNETISDFKLQSSSSINLLLSSGMMCVNISKSIFFYLLPTITHALSSCLFKDTVRLDDLNYFEIPMKRMDCVAGCSLHPVSALICLTSEDDSSSLIMFAGVHYVCKPVEPLSKSNVEMIIHSIDCQMCGVMDEKLIPDSCTGSFSLTIQPFQCMNSRNRIRNGS